MLTAHYNWNLVWLSIAIAVCASYVALDLAGRTASVRGRARALRVIAGAAGMGLGIWATHYIGMLAYCLSIPVAYSLPLVAASLLAAFASSAVALFLVSRRKLGAAYLVGGSLVMGAGIAAMHYIGMCAMHLAAHTVYRPGLVALSVVIAVATSGIAIYLAYFLRNAEKNSAWSRPASAVVMGLAIAGMHYTAMAAVSFYPAASAAGGSNPVSVSNLGAFYIAAATFAVLGLTLLGSLTNRKFSQQQILLDSEVERWSLLIGASQDGLFDVDLVTGFKYVSPRWLAMLGYGPDHPSPVLSWEQRLHPEERESVVARQAQYLSGGAGSFENQFRLRHRDGSWRWILCRAQAVWNQQARPLRLIGSHTDVTERVQHEEQLRTSEARYRELFEHNPLPAWIYRTEDLHFLDVNQAAINHYGWSRDEFLANTVAMVRLPGDVEAIEAELRAAAVSHAQTKPFQHRRNGRSSLWVELYLQDLEVGGQAARLIISHDITARMDAETRLRQANAQMEFLVAQRTSELQTSEAKWRGLVEALPNFISLISSEGVLSYVSGQLETYSGMPIEELLAGGLFQLVHPEDRAGIAASQQAGFATGTEYDAEFRLRSKEGAYRWFLSRARPIYESPGGRVTQWLRSTVDIDDQKHHKEQLEAAVIQRTAELAEALDTAECAVRTKSDFLAAMSHEIRTPMNGVIGMAHLMLDTPLNATQKRYLDTIRSSGQALLTIINDILDFSKIEAGKMELFNEEFDLRSILEQSMELVTPAAAQKQISISLDVHDVPLSVVGDSGRFRQILLNLLSNAVKFTAKGSVQLSVCPDPENRNLLRFTVRDSGIGLSPEQQANLFQAFTQADRSTTRRFGGTGLGLSIAKRLVELMGGQIGVVSRLGEGSVFWFNLPLHHVQAPDPQVGAPVPIPPRRRKSDTFKNIFAGSQARVLVADDVVTNQMVATGMLSEFGLRSDAVSDGVEVIAALESIPYDLILMDVQMPEMDGLEATRRIRAAEAHSGQEHRVPIIALTANAMASDRTKYMEAGMDDFVSKPIMVADLAEVLCRWLPQERSQSPHQSPEKGLETVQPSSSSSLPTSLILNLPGLLSRLMGREPLAIAVLDSFAYDMPGQVQSLVRSAQGDSSADMAHLAHKIRGASATIGGEALQAVATEIEAAAGAGDLAAAKALMPNLEKQFGLLMEAIAAHHPVTLS